MTARPVAIRRLRMPTMTECEQCSALPSDVTRTRARLHVAQTGHTVLVIVEDTTIYRPSEEQR